MTAIARPLLAEFIGTATLLATVVGSGIMGVDLGAGNAAVALLANAAATATMLYALITVLAPISGAHFNPAVTLVALVRREIGAATAIAYVVTQTVAAIVGVMLAHAMFGLEWWQVGTNVRSGPAQWLSEFVATSGLVATIVLGARSAPARVPALVACYIFAAYWFTASTSFANPAVTIARSLTTTFAGIAPAGVPMFVVAQVAGALVALAVTRLLDARASAPEEDLPA